MNPLVAQLVEWTASLTVAPGASPDALRILRALIAASILQDNPGHAEVDLRGLDPWIADAIRDGLVQAEELRQTGIRLRVVSEDMPLGTAFEVPAERPTKELGPFIRKSGGLVRFLAFESAAFLVVRPAPRVPGSLLIPVESQQGADTRTWRLPAGTVWIEARQMVANVAGFACLRISTGELRFDHEPLQVGDQILGVGWSLTVEPEQPDGHDLALPARIETRDGAGAQLSGTLSFEGLSFAPGADAPRAEEGQICFPLDPAGQSWSSAENRSPVMRFSGECPIGSASYALPIVGAEDRPPGEALHGGSLVARLHSGLTGVLAGQSGGPFRWFDAKLTANAQGMELDARQPDSGARYDADLWPKASSTIVFAREPLSRLLFRSRRGGSDTVAVVGGRLRNGWDLPRRADGQPFGFEGVVDAFGLLHDAAGFRIVCLASSPPEDEGAGVALENLYLQAAWPRRCAVVAHPGTGSGTATVFFDASWVLPTLPDPYAWNLSSLTLRELDVDALRIRLTWEKAQPPVMSAHLDEGVMFPAYPDFARDQDEVYLRELFGSQLHAPEREEHESFRLLDLSSREHLFGVALMRSDDQRPTIVDNRLTVALRQVRLLMQPQVQWEPVHNHLSGGTLASSTNGGPALAGANSVKLVPVLPSVVSSEIAEAICADLPAAALFSLPFGLRAMVRLSPRERVHGVTTVAHQPVFGSLQSARQIRLLATGAPDPSRQMPGTLVQLANLAGGGPLTSVLPDRNRLNQDFTSSVPLHHVDLSGYGLSTFSEWSQVADDTGFIKAHFHVLNGRTVYEVIQFQSICWPSQARVVRTIIVQRHNSGSVVRTDSGWVAVTPGLYGNWIPFEKGVIKGLYNIRRVRITGSEAGLTLGPSSQAPHNVVVQPVLFDADAEFEDVVAGGVGGRVPVFDQVGYVQIDPPKAFSPQDLRLFFGKLGPTGGPVNCRIRVGRTMEMQLLNVLADHAPTDADATGFAVAAFGLPKVPRAGQWSAVRIDPSTWDVVAVDSHRGTPISRAGAGPYQFREAADVRRTPRTMYGFMMSTETSRALFPQPRIEATQPGKLFSDRPVLADPYSLCQASGAFPRPSFALRAHESPVFDVTADDHWKIQDPRFTFDQPAPDLLKGGEWAISRVYDNRPLHLNIDSAIPVPWDVNVPPSNLDIDIPPFGKVMTIRTTYVADAAGLPKLDKPNLLFSGALEELKKTLDSLQHLVNLPFHVDVTVTAAGAASASFIVRIDLKFRIGEGPNERIDIGLGKFYGEFLIRGELESGLTGAKRGLLLAQFTGDLQQGILPPLLYAGGLFRFAIEIRDTGRPVVQLTFAAIASLGGDLIKGLIEVEVTVKYGYTLIPENLQPGVFLGMEVRAKLLGGLFGFSFATEVMARIARVDGDQRNVTIAAQIRVVATVQIAYFIEDDVDFETEFEQKIPLAAVALAGGVNPLGAAALL